MFLLTHAYFCLYHSLSNMVIRYTLAAASSFGPIGRWVCAGAVIFVLAYVTAIMETFTISQVCTLCQDPLVRDHVSLYQPC